MRLVVGNMMNILVPVGGLSAVVPQAEDPRGRLTKQGAQAFVDATHAWEANNVTPLMTSGSTGYYPYSSDKTSVPGSAPGQEPVQTAWNAAQQVITSRPADDRTAHDVAIRQATNARIAKGESPVDAALNAQKDTAQFYGKLTAMTEAERQQFYKFSQALADQDQQKKQTAVNQKIADMTQANMNAGMTPVAAKAKADNDATQFFQKLATATPEELANFKRMTETLAQNEANAKAKAAADAAANAARKMESDKLKNQAAQVVRARRISQPLARSRFLRS